MSGGLGIVDFMNLATRHGTLSTTGYTVDGDPVFGKKLIEIDVLITEIIEMSFPEMISQSFAILSSVYLTPLDKNSITKNSMTFFHINFFRVENFLY